MEFKDYEANLEQLKGIVRKLESGNLSLDENMEEYKKGMQLYGELEECLRRSKGELVKIEGEQALPFLREGIGYDGISGDYTDEPNGV